MPIVQPYNINTGDAYEGMVYGLRTAMTIRTVEDARSAENKACEAGKAVTAVANTVRGVEGLGGAASTAGNTCYGIIVRQINHEAAARPSLDGKMAYQKGDLLGLLEEGEVMVKLGATIKRDEAIGMETNGKWGKTGAYANVIALKGGNDGDIVPARIFIMKANPVVTRAAK